MGLGRQHSGQPADEDCARWEGRGEAPAGPDLRLHSGEQGGCVPGRPAADPGSSF